MTRPKAQRTTSADDYQTPPETLLPLCPYLPAGITIWECAAGNGNLVKGLQEHGYKVIATDILSGQNFLMWEPAEPWDCMITNPPYSLKQQFLERAYLLGKPFAFLLPLTTFETPKRQMLFKDYGLEVVFLPKRTNFETPNGKGSGAWFAVAWFTWGLKIGRQLVFP